MNKHLKNILKSVLLIGLISVLLTPSVLNFIHSLEHHKHVIDCNEKEKTHLHAIEFDCRFIQLYATPQIYDSIVYFSLEKNAHYHSSIHSDYSSEHFHNIFIGNQPLRGPPVLI
ncbi:MAG: hypothetical protein COA88_10090 [Kordia sp.]|nr:MAG: hypothetical protein COA88_10090 [Kordia sp.]